jgi:hypothetical protein
MGRDHKPRDRVRVTAESRVPGYRPGDRGRVLRELVSTTRGALYYVVAMDKDDPSEASAVFSEDEIELDVGTRNTEALVDAGR